MAAGEVWGKLGKHGEVRRGSSLGKENTNLFSDFNFNDDSDLSIFDNGGFTSRSKDESLFLFVYER